MLDFYSTVKNLIKRVRYFGFAYQCPTCSAHVRYLHPYGETLPVVAEKQVVGAGRRLNGNCPVCFSTDRERLLHIYLNQRILRNEAQSILHVAPEPTLRVLIESSPKLRYVTGSIFPSSGEESIDITSIQYPDETFDLVICNHVLEHVIEDRKAISELFRVLKKNGKALLQVPIARAIKTTHEDSSITSSEDRERYFAQWDHVRLYGMDYVERLEKGGFDVEVFDWWKEENLPEFGRTENRYGLTMFESIFVGHKA